MVLRASDGSRLRRLTDGQLRKKQKKEAAKRPALPGVTGLVRTSLGVWLKHWRPLGAVLIIFALLFVVVGSGYTNVNNSFDNFKDSFDNAADTKKVGNAVAGFGSLFGNARAAGSDSSVVLQVLLAVLTGLAIIWLLRQIQSGKLASVKTAFYRSGTPLVPFLLVILWLALVLLPMATGATLFNAVLAATSGFGATALFGILFGGLAIFSIYWLIAGLWALFIVTLPGMEPWSAIVSSHKLTRFRRLNIFVRVVGLGLIIFLAMGAIIVPSIIWFPRTVPYVFTTLLVLAFFFAETYLYSLYRSLLKNG